jgi:hypothetical protein
MRITYVRSFALATFLVFAASGAHAAGKKLSLSERVEVAAPPAKVWNTIKDFNGWQAWHPAIGSTEITKGKGNTKHTVRVLNTKDGARITEELMSYSAGAMSYTYRIVDSPLPVTDYVSTLKVTKSKGGSIVVWSSTFKAKEGTSDDDAKKTIAGIYRAGLDNLANVVK